MAHGGERCCRVAQGSLLSQAAQCASVACLLDARRSAALIRLGFRPVRCRPESDRVNPTLTAFEHSPDQGRGLARDLPVRWALEEAGQAYAVRLLSFAALKAPAHRALHPFGQIPTYEEDGLVLFESGAIVLHLAERHPGLLPREAPARARAIMWMFAALNTVEPPIFERSLALITERGQPWHAQRLPLLEERVRIRLADLSTALGSQAWLEGAFSAADLLMVGVLRRLKGSGLLEHHANLPPYVARGEARPAFQRAFAAHTSPDRLFGSMATPVSLANDGTSGSKPGAPE